VGPFYSAVRQAQIATNSDSRGVDFAFSPGQLVLSAQASDLGRSRVELPVAFDDKPVTVTLDPRFFGDFLKVLDPGTSFMLEIRNSESAVVCRTDDGYAYVIMPLARAERKN
jgi:DNA polymerase-3 subunit beta